MGPLLLLLFVAVVFSWLVVRSVRAGYGKGIFWLAWYLIGLAVVLSQQTPAPLEARILINVWATSVIALPVWWTLRWLVRAPRSPR